MYGTRKEINQILKRAFGNDEPLAVLVWSRESLTAVDENMTFQEVNHLLRRTGEIPLYDHTTYGISLNTLYQWLTEYRADAVETSGSIRVDAALLARVVKTAEEALRAAETSAGEAANDAIPSFRRGLEDVRSLRSLLPA